ALPILAVIGFADHLKVGLLLQQEPEAAAHDGMVVSQEYADVCHRAPGTIIAYQKNRVACGTGGLSCSLLNTSQPANPQIGIAVAIQNAAVYECTSNSRPKKGIIIATAALQEPAPTPAIRPA